MTKSTENDALALLRSCARHEWMDSTIERMRALWMDRTIERMRAYKPDWSKGKKTVFEGADIGADDGLAKWVDEAPVTLSNEKERITP